MRLLLIFFKKLSLSHLPIRWIIDSLMSGTTSLLYVKSLACAFPIASTHCPFVNDDSSIPILKWIIPSLQNELHAANFLFPSSFFFQNIYSIHYLLFATPLVQLPSSHSLHTVSSRLPNDSCLRLQLYQFYHIAPLLQLLPGDMKASSYC